MSARKTAILHQIAARTHELLALSAAWSSPDSEELAAELVDRLHELEAVDPTWYTRTPARVRRPNTAQRARARARRGAALGGAAAIHERVVRTTGVRRRCEICRGPIDDPTGLPVGMCLECFRAAE